MPSDDRGFTMIETLVALTILAGAMSAVLLAVSSSRDAAARSALRIRAAFAADALLARVGLDLTLRPQSLGGRLADGAAWTLTIAPYAETATSRLWTVTVGVTPQGDRGAATALSTLRLAAGLQ